MRPPIDSPITNGGRRRCVRTRLHACEAVVLEAAWVLGSPIGMLTVLVRGDLVLARDFDFRAEVPRLLEGSVSQGLRAMATPRKRFAPPKQID